MLRQSNLLAIALCVASLVARPAQAGDQAPSWSAPERDLCSPIVTPGRSVDGLVLGASLKAVRDLLGEPSRVNAATLEYDSRALGLTFNESGALSMIGVGDATRPERVVGVCRATVDSRFGIGDPPDAAIAALGAPALRRDDGRLIFLAYPKRGIHLHFIDQRLSYLAVFSPRRSESQSRSESPRSEGGIVSLPSAGTTGELSRETLSIE